MNCLNKNNIYVLHRSTVERFKKSLYGAFCLQKKIKSKWRTLYMKAVRKIFTKFLIPWKFCKKQFSKGE